MNYLAHLYFSDLTPESCAGQLLPDCMAPPEVLPHASPELASHIRLHQAIDQFTDHHPHVVALKREFQPPFRRFAGILLDVRFDQSLARQWSRWHHLSLESFGHAVYDALAAYHGPENDRLRRLRLALIQHQWLCDYRHDVGIQRALSSLDRRSRFRTPLAEAQGELKRLDSQIEQTFNTFFPDLQAHVSANRDDLPGH